MAAFAAVLAFVAGGPAAPIRAAAPVQLAETGPFAEIATAATPDGGYLLAWQDRSLSIHGREISPGGFPAPGVLDLVPPVSSNVSQMRMAVAATGDRILVWTQPSGADQVGVGGAVVAADGSPVRVFEIPDPIPDPGGLVIGFGPQVTALPGGGFALAWTVGIQEDPLGDPLVPSEDDAYVVLLDAEGRPAGEPVRLHEGVPGNQLTSGIGASGSSLVVSWEHQDGDEVREVAQVLDLDLSPVSAAVGVTEEDGGRTSLAVAPDGRFVVGWGTFGFAPGDFRAMLRPFAADGTPAGPPVELDPGGGPLQGSPLLALTGERVLWAAWVEARDGGFPGGSQEAAIEVRPFTIEGVPMAPPQELARVGAGTVTLAGGERGALVAWTPTDASPVVIGQVVGRPAEAELPPDELALASPEVPGFRVWVRIAQGDFRTIWGTETLPCLAEALCAAGALPDRAEVIVRVVGPKPNGFLWPTIVKLSTSRVEVWIEQLATGDAEYYLLPGASPGSETLPGLFDRTGFEP